tara:strand:- start:269 stop:568 length:300 start_codon:yes stop_codon:yes gene_type:complete
MGKKVNSAFQCGFMGCGLSLNHAGMHQVCLKIKKRGRTDEYKDKCVQVFENKYAKISNSPCRQRKDVLLHKDKMKLKEMEMKLKSMQKDISNMLHILQS